MSKTKVWWLGSQKPHAKLIDQLNAEELELEWIPLMTTQSIILDRPIDLANYDAVYFVSKAAVDGWFTNCSVDRIREANLKIITTGHGTAEYLEQVYQLSVTHINPYKTAADFFQHFDFSQEGIATLAVPISHQSQGKYQQLALAVQDDIWVDEVIVYQKQVSEFAEGWVTSLFQTLKEGDVLVVTSPSNWQALRLMKSISQLKELSDKSTIYSIGPLTSAALREDSIQNFCEAKHSNYQSLVQLIIQRKKEDE